MHPRPARSRRRSFALMAAVVTVMLVASGAHSAPENPEDEFRQIVNRVGHAVAEPIDGTTVPPVVPGVGAATGDTGQLHWPNEMPEGSPFPRSERFSGIAFDGPYATYGVLGDTYYPSWGADGKLYSPYMDGFCGATGSYGGYPFPISTLGMAVIDGDDPTDLDLSCGMRTTDRGDEWDGRYASASLHHDGVWYYGSYLLADPPQEGAPDCNLNYCTLGPFVGFDVSHDGGHTWEISPHTADAPLFGESIADGHRIRLGALHVVDFGRNNEHSPDGKMYLVGHGGGDSTSTANWVAGDNVYLLRVEPSAETVNDPDAYEFYAGEVDGEPVWSDDLEDLEPFVSWPGHLGSATITYSPGIDRYLMWISRPEDGVTTTKPYDTMLLEAPSLTGPWAMVHYLPRFGIQAFFVNTPSKFVSDDGLTSWLSYSANFINYEESNPEGSNYYWVLRKMTLLEP